MFGFISRTLSLFLFPLWFTLVWQKFLVVFIMSFFTDGAALRLVKVRVFYYCFNHFKHYVCNSYSILKFKKTHWSFFSNSAEDKVSRSFKYRFFLKIVSFEKRNYSSSKFKIYCFLPANLLICCRMSTRSCLCHYRGTYFVTSRSTK